LNKKKIFENMIDSDTQTLPLFQSKSKSVNIVHRYLREVDCLRNISLLNIQFIKTRVLVAGPNKAAGRRGSGPTRQRADNAARRQGSRPTRQRADKAAGRQGRGPTRQRADKAEGQQGSRPTRQRADKAYGLGE